MCETNPARTRSRNRPTNPLQNRVAGAADQDQPLIAKWNHFKARLAERKRDHSEVDRLITAGLINLVSSTIFNINFDLWVHSDELLDERWQSIKSDTIDSRDANHAGDSFARGAEAGIEGIITNDDLLELLVHHPTSLGWSDVSTMDTLDQLPVISLLERSDLLTDSGLRDKVQRRRSRKAARFDKVAKCLDRFDMQV